MTVIKLHNSKTRLKTDFTPIDAKNVRLYVCGPTVYDRAHIGNARPVIVFDQLFRLLRHVFGENHVTYVRNFTDVDDKINAAAAKRGLSIRHITDETIAWYHEDMDAIGALRPTHAPRATDYIAQMLDMIGDLIAKGHAYVAAGHVLFDVRSYSEYGQFSGRGLDDMIAGARVEVAPYKRDPLDFVLWKPSGVQEPGWDSLYGYGRPGWHIECSALAVRDLGTSIDLHGGGSDLIFPHHECERAQSEAATGKQFVKHWMHVAMVFMDGTKMSKSLGNLEFVDRLRKTHDPRAIRLALISNHYRREWEWTSSSMNASLAKLELWNAAKNGDGTAGLAEVRAALDDDLNTPAAIQVIDQAAAAGHSIKSSAKLLGIDLNS